MDDTASRRSCLHRRRVVGHQIVTEVVALVHRGPDDVGARLQRQSNWIANAGGVDAIAAAVRVELENRGAAAVLTGVVVRLRSDRDIHLASARLKMMLRVECPPPAGSSARVRPGLQIAVRVPVADERGCVADVEVAVVEGDAEGRADLAGAFCTNSGGGVHAGAFAPRIDGPPRPPPGPPPPCGGGPPPRAARHQVRQLPGPAGAAGARRGRRRGRAFGLVSGAGHPGGVAGGVCGPPRPPRPPTGPAANTLHASNVPSLFASRSTTMVSPPAS